jgi:hypothetical protein
LDGLFIIPEGGPPKLRHSRGDLKHLFFKLDCDIHRMPENERLRDGNALYVLRCLEGIPDDGTLVRQAGMHLALRKASQKGVYQRVGLVEIDRLTQPTRFWLNGSSLQNKNP